MKGASDAELGLEVEFEEKHRTPEEPGCSSRRLGRTCVWAACVFVLPAVALAPRSRLSSCGAALGLGGMGDAVKVYDGGRVCDGNAMEKF